MPVQFYIFVSWVQAVLFLGHFFIYKTFVAFLDINDPGALTFLRILTFVLSLTFVSASLLSFKFHSWLVRKYYTLAATWIGFLYSIFVASLLLWVFYAVTLLINWQLDLRPISKTVYLCTLFLSIYGFANAHKTKLTSIRVKLPNMPEQWKGKKAALVGDIHLGHVRNINFSRHVSDFLDKIEAEIIFMTGDFYDGTPVHFEELAEPFLKLAKKNKGMYYVTGNHEEFRSKDNFVNAIKKAGMKVLDNEMVEVEGLQILGVDYKDSSHEGSFEKILESLNFDSQKPSILLKHVPDSLHIAEKAGVSMQLSGHTHLGQVYPFRFLTRKIFKGYDYGLKKYKKMLVYTTSGVGTWGPPMRVGTKAEVVEIIFE